MPTKLILIRHSGLRQVDESAVLAAIDPELRLGSRESVHVDTQEFEKDIAVGEWAGHEAYLQGCASEVRRLSDTADGSEVHYAGLAQIPHVIAFGASLGSERKVVVHEYDRDQDSWAWPSDSSSAQVVVLQPAMGPIITSRGVAVLRISISAQIQDADIRAVVGEEVLADVTVCYGEGAPATTRVRCEADLLEIRKAVREALAGIRNNRPNVETLHLFVAAPNCVCLLVGQELVPRNSPPTQTYVYRFSTDGVAYAPAILIGGAYPAAAIQQLSTDEIELAGRLRSEIWTKALAQIKSYAARKAADRARGGSTSTPWYADLLPQPELSLAAPFPALPSVGSLVHQEDEIDGGRYFNDYAHDPERHRWLLSDQLILGMYRAAKENDEALLPLVRLFFFHEYVHAHHSLTKYTAANVGKFANALERLDYTADTFAIFHELDFQHYAGVGSGAGVPNAIRVLGDQVERILCSFWAFDGLGPHLSMQMRRVRRYLNWYWRLAQLRRARTVQEAVLLFTRSPAVELAGVKLHTDGERRVSFVFEKARTERPEVAIVLEDERLLRLTEGDSTSILGLLEAFRSGNHEALIAWFRPVFELAHGMGQVFPSMHPDLDRDV